MELSCGRRCASPGPGIPGDGHARDNRVFAVAVAALARLLLAWAFSAVFGTLAAQAAGLVLVTKEDVQAELQAGLKEPPRRRAVPVPGAPQIRVLQPVISGKPLQNPLRIELQFVSEPNVEIDPDSFRAFYGFLRIDLTERIVKNLRVQKSGLTVENAEIPPGSHRLFLRITDSKQRANETELRFVVE